MTQIKTRRFRASILALAAMAFLAAVPATAIDDHLVLCEAVVTLTADEFIEIANPTAAAVDLTDYYLSDDEDYALLPGHFGAGPAPAIGSSDFIARFPAGTSIPAGGVIVVAFDGAGFLATFGTAASFEIHGTDAGTPDMLAAYAGSIGATAGLTNSGENAALFFWDGGGDLVGDVDMTNIGTPSSTNDIGDKSGLAVDGPDADAIATPYTTDAFSMPQQAGDPGAGASTKRLALELGFEVTGGGNGITGDDETSENIAITWDGPPFSAPNPFVCDVAPLVPVFVINEIHADPDAGVGDANGDGTVSTTQDEFVELVNVTGAPVDISGWTLSDAIGMRHTFPAGSFIADQCGVVIFGGGSPTGVFGGVVVQTASTGGLGLNNTGDTVKLNDGSTDIATAAYGSEGGDNQSITLDPDVTGSPPYVKHSVATGSGGALFSPGTRIDGSQLGGCPLPPASWVINEIHADPDATNGDANGDGTVSTTQDEFVEIVNNSGAAADISGWTVSDGFGVRHTFPGGTVVPDQCSVVVFAGGSPTGDFGGSEAQTASGGSLGFNNTGDTVTLNDGVSDIATVSYGSEGGDNQSLTRDPDITGPTPLIRHTLATGSGGAIFSPGTRVDGSLFSGCPVPPSPWVINEIHADPDGSIAGDANGDGTRSGSGDEFVEIVNTTGSDLDISGWTLSDAVAVRHTFPLGSVVLDGCSVVVFGGGTPTGTFGNSLVQTASGGFLGFNNTGDDITLNDGSSDIAMATYGSEGNDNQSLTLDPDVTGSLPYVKHSVATGSGGALYSPGTRIDGSQFDGCPVAAEIYEIQGSGAASPLDGKLVSTDADVVTALAPDGFFMQTPAPGDADIDTSDGIFVFTGGAPGVAVGDLVDVTGNVQEFFGFTEFGFGSSVTVVGSGAVPAPVGFDANVPSRDPVLPSCAIEFECYEGMLVEILEGTVTGPNQRFGTDPTAEVHIVAGSNRAFREPGVEFPFFMPPIPTWDGNPEVFELDPDKLGLVNQIIPAGSTFSATGVVGFEFGGYELWPTSLTVTPAPLPVAVRARAPGEFTVGTLNVFRLFDDVDDPPDGARNDFVVSTAEYQRRLDKFSAYIRDVLDSPDVLGVQEAEKLGVLEDLADRIALDDPAVVYSAFLVEGNDIGTIDVGFLVRDNINVDAITQLGKAETFVNPITLEDDILHDRPPLLLEGSCQLEFGTFPIAAMVVHNRSLGGIDGSEGERVRVKRLRQAESIATKVQDLQTADPAVRLVVLGDFNAFEFTDGYVDTISVIEGDFDDATSFVCGEAVCLGDLVEPNLDNQVLGVDGDDRYSFIFRGSAQVLDHALTSSGLAAEMAGAEYGRGNADAAVDLINDDSTLLRSSDHDGLVIYVVKDEDADGVPNDLDVCAGTVISESVPTVVLKTNRWALVDGNGQFDTNLPEGEGPGLTFDLGDTAGCSCEQIIDAQGLGNGHRKHGCSIGAMRNWVKLVNP